MTEQEQIIDSQRYEQQQEETYNVSLRDASNVFSKVGQTARPRIATGEWFRGTLQNENQWQIYDQLADYFEAIYRSGSGQSMLKIMSGISLATTSDCEAAIDALLKDHTELIYWVSKGTGSNFLSAVNQTPGGELVGTQAILLFPVIPEYKGSKIGAISGQDYFAVNANKGVTGQTKEAALAVANQIVADATGSDYKKIKYFNEKICALTSYDYAALEPGAVYGDESQLTNAFLGKPVVCEGYAKAFKYLCDQANIGCFIIEGSLDGVNHMWNYVQLGEKWYIVDVTNNDGNTNITRLLAIGSGNANYAGHYTLFAKDAGGAIFSPLNPGVTVETNDYDGQQQPPAEPEQVRLIVNSATSNCLELVVTNKADAHAPLYEGGYTLAKEDITVTQLTTAGTGNVYFPESVSSQGGGYYSVIFQSSLPAGTYLLSVREKAGFVVTEITNNPFSVKAQLSTPIIQFGELDATGNVTVTITVPGSESANVLVEYWVNSVSKLSGCAPLTFQISANEPDRYPTKEIVASASHADYEASGQAKATYHFTPSADAFQVIITPVNGLRGFITNKTLMATLATKNASGTVGYEIDNTRYYGGNGGFSIEGDKVYSIQGYQFDPTSYPLYVIAIDDKNDSTAANPTAYGSAVIQIQPAGGDTGGSGSGGGSSGSGSSGGGSGGLIGAGSPSYSVSKAQQDADKALALALSQAAVDKQVVTAKVRLQNIKLVTPQVLKALLAKAEKAQKDKGIPVKMLLLSDIVKNGKVESRMYINPANATLSSNIKLGVSLDNKLLRSQLQKLYSNNMLIVNFEQRGSFGMPLEIAVRVNLSKLNSKTLVFYSYDAITKTSTLIEKPMYRIDQSGYLHFTTTVGNNIVITDSLLVQK